MAALKARQQLLLGTLHQRAAEEHDLRLAAEEGVARVYAEVCVCLCV